MAAEARELTRLTAAEIAAARNSRRLVGIVLIVTARTYTRPEGG